MKQVVKWAATTVAAAAIAGSALADQIISVELSGDAKQDGLFACAGLEEDHARFGGVQVGPKGKIQVMAPAQDYNGGLMSTVTISVAGNGMAGQTQVNLAEYQAAGGREPVTVSLKRSDLSCGQTISGAEYAKAWSERAEALSEEVLKEVRSQYGQVSPRVYARYVADNSEALQAYADTQFVPNGPTRAALADAIGKLDRIQRAKEREAASKKFIQDLAAAAQAYAEERDKKLADARATARAEAEARAKAEAEKQLEQEKAEEVRGEISEGCFGAIGPGCGIWEGKFPPSLCGPSDIIVGLNRFEVDWGCAINSGSWKHDECCAANPNGHWCFGPDKPNNSCAVSFDRGLANLLTPYTWERKDVDISIRNTVGTVVHADYCANPGTVMWKDETQYCCQKSGHELNGGELWAFTTTHGAWAFNTGNTRVCDRKT